MTEPLAVWPVDWEVNQDEIICPGSGHPLDGQPVSPKSDINILRRRMFSVFTLEVKAGQTVVLEKYSNVFTSRDKELAGMEVHQLQAHALAALQAQWPEQREKLFLLLEELFPHQ